MTEIADRADKKIVIKPRPVAIKFPIKRKSVGTDETSMSEISTLPSISKIHSRLSLNKTSYGEFVSS